MYVISLRYHANLSLNIIQMNAWHKDCRLEESRSLKNYYKGLMENLSFEDFLYE